MSGGVVSGAAVRNTPPESDDFGEVVRPIGGGSGGSTEVIQNPSAGAVNAIPANAASTLLLAANPLRSGFAIRNTSESATIYVLLNTAGGAASAINHTFALGPLAYYEDPFNYVGDVVGIWSVVNPGDLALVTEFSPT